MRISLILLLFVHNSQSRELPNRVTQLRQFSVNKRGIFFTTLAIVILILFLTSYTFHTAAAKRNSIHDRITTMNNFLTSLEADLSRNVYIAAFRTLVVYEQKIAESGTYISNLNMTVSEAFLNGTFNNEPQSIMVGATFPELYQVARDKARTLNINITLSNATMTLTQEEPWKVTATMRTHLLMEDATGIARWNKTLIVSSKIDIQNFNDPLYTVKTQGKVMNKINRSSFEPFVIGASVANLSKHMLNSSYTNTTSAPSYLDRIQGLSGPNPQGIESLINVQLLAAQGIVIEEKSVVDYIYFSSQNPASSTITGMPSWFRIDESHVDRYGVRHLSSFA